MPDNTIAIVGMHRSGTSLTAAWLQRSGLAIDAGSLISASTWNPKGHFEDKHFVTFHENMIKNAAGRSDGWRFYSSCQHSFRQPALTIAKNMIKERNEKYEVWGWKDPRTTHFAEAWTELIPSLKVLAVWRPAPQVTRSLVRRTDEKHLKIGRFNAVRLWSAHNRLICEYKRRHPENTILVALDSLINENSLVVDLLQRKWGLDLEYVPISSVFEDTLIKKGSQNDEISLLPRKFNSVYSITESLMRSSDL